MSLQSALYAELAGASAVTTQVGTNSTTSAPNVYAGRVPNSAGDNYISFVKISNTHARSFTSGSGLAFARVQIDCVGESPAKANLICEAVRATLDNFRGTLGSGANTLTVRACLLDSDFEDWLEPVQAAQEGPCRAPMDFIIAYVESAIDNIE